MEYRVEYTCADGAHLLVGWFGVGTDCAAGFQGPLYALLRGAEVGPCGCRSVDLGYGEHAAGAEEPCAPHWAKVEVVGCQEEQCDLRDAQPCAAGGIEISNGVCVGNVGQANERQHGVSRVHLGRFLPPCAHWTLQSHSASATCNSVLLQYAA